MSMGSAAGFATTIGFVTAGEEPHVRSPTKTQFLREVLPADTETPLRLIDQLVSLNVDEESDPESGSDSDEVSASLLISESTTPESTKSESEDF